MAVMNIFNAALAKVRFADLLRFSERGCLTTVTRHDRPVAVVLPINWPRWVATCARCLPDAPGVKIDCGGIDCERCGTPADFWVPGPQDRCSTSNIGRATHV